MLRATARLAPRLVPRAEAALGTRGMTMSGLKGYDDREAAEEMLYFKKEDEKLMRQLLSKVRNQAAQNDPQAAAGALEAEKAQLKSIVGKYNIADADLLALIKWKHEVHH